MNWLIHQLELIYAAEQRALREHVTNARNAMRQHLTDVFDASAQEGTWNADDARFNDRMRRLTILFTATLNALMEEVRRELLTYETAAYRMGYYGTAWQMDGEQNTALNISRLQDDLIHTTLEAPYIDATLRQRLFDTQSEFETRVRRELTQSQTEGENLTQATRRMNGLWGLNPQTNALAARTLWLRVGAIALSEFWRAGNIGAREALLDNRGLLAGKQWHTSQMENVCARCKKLHGVIVPLDAKFIDTIGHVEVDGPTLHPLCNCFLTPALLEGGLNPEPYIRWYARRNLNDEDGRAILT